MSRFVFFFNDTATTEIYTFSLHDALPISAVEDLATREIPPVPLRGPEGRLWLGAWPATCGPGQDRKSTRLNSSHANISYAVFCLKKKKQHDRHHPTDTTMLSATTKSSLTV